MKHSDFFIGMEFYLSGRRLKVTDIGTRTLAAIRVDEVTMTKTSGVEEGHTSTLYNTLDAEKNGYFIGPPYWVAEFLIDEYDQEGCEHVYEYLFHEQNEANEDK